MEQTHHSSREVLRAGGRPAATVPKKVYEQVKEKGDVRGYERGVHMDASQTLVGLTDLNTK